MSRDRLTLLSELEDFARAADEPADRAAALAHVAWAHAERGDLDRARTLALTAGELARLVPGAAPRLWARIWRALVAWRFERRLPAPLLRPRRRFAWVDDTDREDWRARALARAAAVVERTDGPGAGTALLQEALELIAGSGCEARELRLSLPSGLGRRRSAPPRSFAPTRCRVESPRARA